MRSTNWIQLKAWAVKSRTVRSEETFIHHFPKRNAHIRGKVDQIRERVESCFNLYFNFLLPCTVKILISYSNRQRPSVQFTQHPTTIFFSIFLGLEFWNLIKSGCNEEGDALPIWRSFDFLTNFYFYFYCQHHNSHQQKGKKEEKEPYINFSSHSHPALSFSS